MNQEAILKQQPPAGEFTKDFREQIGRQAVGIGSLGEIQRMAKEACVIIDRAEASNKDLLEIKTSIQNESDKLDAQIKEGKGVWLKPGYIKDDDWAGMIRERLVYHRVLRLFEAAIAQSKQSVEPEAKKE